MSIAYPHPYIAPIHTTAHLHPLSRQSDVRAPRVQQRERVGMTQLYVSGVSSELMCLSYQSTQPDPIRFDPMLSRYDPFPLRSPIFVPMHTTPPL